MPNLKYRQLLVYTKIFTGSRKLLVALLMCIEDAIIFYY